MKGLLKQLFGLFSMHTSLHPSSCPEITFDQKKICKNKILTGEGEHHVSLKHVMLVLLTHGWIWWAMVCGGCIEHHVGGH